MTNINEALAKRKRHYLSRDYSKPPLPLCRLSPETIYFRGIGFYYTAVKSNVTCKRCIRSLTGRYDR